MEEAQELISRVDELEKEKERERSAMMFKANVVSGTPQQLMLFAHLLFDCLATDCCWV